MGLYDNIKTLCKEHGTSINQLEKDLGWCRSSISKFDTNSPSIEKVRQISDYFGVTVDEVAKGKEYTNLDLQMFSDKGEHYYVDESAREMAEFLFQNPEYRVLFDASRNVKKEDIEFVKQMLDRFKGDDNDKSSV